MKQGSGLEVNGLVAGYGDITILDGVSFKLQPESIVALLGANGAGKTTSLNALSGLEATVRGGQHGASYPRWIWRRSWCGRCWRR